MLFGEQRRRAEQGDLLAGRHGDERGAQCDLGLAEADIAADEAVHRLAGGHVRGDGGDRGGLVRRLLEAEAVGERFHVSLREAERGTVPRGPPGVELEQLGGGVAYLPGRAGSRLVPLAAAQLVQRRLLGLRARIARYHLELRYRDVELVAAVVFEQQKLRQPFAQVQVDEAAVA